MMRMMKRAAVGILAAAMALSMLTACGGASAGPSTSGSTSTGGSGNPGSSSSSSASSSNSNGSSSSSSSSSAEFTYRDSLTYKYNLQRSNSKTWYQKTDRIDSNGKRNIYESAMVFGSDHRVQKSYYKSSYSNGSTYESLAIDGTNYTLYRDAKIATASIYKSNGSSSSSEGEIYRMNSIVKTTQKVDNVSYYAEVTTYKGDKTGKTMTQSYCFDTKGKLVYTIMVEDGQEYKTHILDYSTFIPGSVLMEIPSDWSVYTFDYTTTPKTVTDAAGNKLTDDEIAQLNKKIYKW